MTSSGDNYFFFTKNVYTTAMNYLGNCILKLLIRLQTLTAATISRIWNLSLEGLYLWKPKNRQWTDNKLNCKRCHTTTGRVISSYFSTDTRHVTLFTNTVISNEWGKDRFAITTSSINVLRLVLRLANIWILNGISLHRMFSSN